MRARPSGDILLFFRRFFGADLDTRLVDAEALPLPALFPSTESNSVWSFSICSAIWMAFLSCAVVGIRRVLAQPATAVHTNQVVRYERYQTTSTQMGYLHMVTSRDSRGPV